MNFKTALEQMQQGRRVKLPEWQGYWAWENDTVMMYCKDGEVLDIRATEDVAYTLSNIVREDWQVVE